MSLKKIIKVAAFAIALTASAAHAELVTNGNFETGNLSGFSVDPNGIGYVGVDSEAPRTGAFSAFFAGTDPASPDTISQTLATEIGATYHISFWLQSEADANPDSMFSASFGNTLLVSLMNDPGFAYRNFTYDLVASSASSVLSFTGYNAPTAYDLDDVSVTRVGSAEVPEPGTAALLGLGFVGMMRLRRKQSA